MNRTLGALGIFALGILLNSRNALGQIAVLTDTGRTVVSVQHLSHALDSADSDAETPLISFPVTTTFMSEGALIGRDLFIKIPPWMTRPVFIVGSDPQSIKWLQENAIILLALQASGLVVSVPDVASFKLMRRSVPLPMVPDAAPFLLRTLVESGIKHYPVLLLESGRVYQDLQPLSVAARASGVPQ